MDLCRLTSDEDAIFNDDGQDVDVGLREEVKEKHRGCQEQHQNVYAQLSTLVHLHAVHLEFEYIHPGQPLNPAARFTNGGRLCYACIGSIPNILELSLK